MRCEQIVCLEGLVHWFGYWILWTRTVSLNSWNWDWSLKLWYKMLEGISKHLHLRKALHYTVHWHLNHGLWGPIKYNFTSFIYGLQMIWLFYGWLIHNQVNSLGVPIAVNLCNLLLYYGEFLEFQPQYSRWMHCISCTSTYFWVSWIFMEYIRGRFCQLLCGVCNPRYVM